MPQFDRPISFFFKRLQILCKITIENLVRQNFQFSIQAILKKRPFCFTDGSIGKNSKYFKNCETIGKKSTIFFIKLITCVHNSELSFKYAFR